MIIKQNSIVPFANVAQSVEQLIRNQQVMGSSPIISSKISDSFGDFLFCGEPLRINRSAHLLFRSENRKRLPLIPKEKKQKIFKRGILPRYLTLYIIQNGNATERAK